MEFKTKYKIGDIVYFIQHNKIVRRTVDHIQVTILPVMASDIYGNLIQETKSSVRYFFNSDNDIQNSELEEKVFTDWNEMIKEFENLYK